MIIINMLIYLLFGGTLCACAFGLGKLWKLNIQRHKQQLQALKSKLQDSLDYETNDLKQQWVQKIDGVFCGFFKD